ncbi:MAG: dTMP kinase [Sulfuriferula sp.]
MPFITLEGIDGAGKTSHLAWLADKLRARGVEVVVTREPGGTPLGEKLREILLAEPMHVETEALLMFAARREHLHRVILPALSRGAYVISDRFTDASFAYQCGGRGIAESRLLILEDWVQEGLQPDLTLLFDVEVAIAAKRLSANASLDRFEQEQQDFFERVRAMYLQRAKQYPARFRIIGTNRSLEDIRASLEPIIAAI